MSVPVTVTAKDKHSVTVMDAGTGNFRGTYYITSGEILGQPQQAGDMLTVTCSENGKTWIKVYSLPTMNFKRQTPIS